VSVTDRWRLFIATPLPEPVRADLLSRLAPYRDAHPTVRWLAAPTWHLTLLFLGHVPARHVPELASLLDAIAADTEPFPVTVSGGGGRVRTDDGVAWLRLADGASRFIGLADRLAAACPPDATTGALPRRTPSAHVTVARRADLALVSDLRAEGHGPLRVGWLLARMALLRSHLGPSGARYETLHEVTMYAADG
jgi:2'-5' RNA ligase